MRWILLIQIGGGSWRRLNKTINNVCFSFWMMSRIGNQPWRGTAKIHRKNKNIKNPVFIKTKQKGNNSWGEFPSHVLSARVLVLMLRWLWSPPSEQWFHHSWRDHTGNYLSSATGGKIMSACRAADVATAPLTALFRCSLSLSLYYKTEISSWRLLHSHNICV